MPDEDRALELEPRYPLSVADVAKLTGLSETFVREAAHEEHPDHLPCLVYRDRRGQVVKFNREEVLEWLSARRRP